MTSIAAPAYCWNCRHYGDWLHGEGIVALAQGMDGVPFGHSCQAFPDGIPVEVWLGELRHDQPLAGDNGVQFEAQDAQGPTPASCVAERPE